MGVVPGIVMNYQFGTNWSVFSDRVGPMIGPLMGYEVLSAYFFEAGYVLLDGFDLGVGILIPLIKGESNRDEAMNSVAPVWDGNETWLGLGGGGLLAVFPLAYPTSKENPAWIPARLMSRSSVPAPPA